MTFTYDDVTYSDLHKDARGYRPTPGGYAAWDEATPEQKQVIWDRLCDELGDRMAEDARNEAAAAHDFELTVQDLLRAGATDRSMAIKWLHEAHETRGDANYLEYCLGLKYGYLGLDN